MRRESDISGDKNLVGPMKVREIREFEWFICLGILG